jgi:CysZ protein
MKAIENHFFAIKVAFEKLAKGSFWLYLIPSLVVSFLFLKLFAYINATNESASSLESVPFIGTYLSQGAKSTLSFIDSATLVFYKFFIVTILSPFNCLLSEKVDNELTGSKFSGGITRMLVDLWRTIVIVILAMLMNLAFKSIWWVISWIIGFHLFDDMIYFSITAFFLGFSFYDYSLERYRFGTFSSFGFGFNKIFNMFITGAIFSSIFMIPYLGVIFAPFLATIISTIVYLKMNKKLNKIDTINEQTI